MNLENRDQSNQAMNMMPNDESSSKDSSSASATNITSTPTKPKSTRGFASMDREKQREIARKGGKAAHEKGTAHEFTPDEARAAGRKGGEAVSRDRRHMAEIGREGGQARGLRVAQRKQDMLRQQQGSQNENETADTSLSVVPDSDGERQSKAS